MNAKKFVQKRLQKSKSRVIEISKAYSEPSETSKIEFLTEIVNGFLAVTIFAESSIIHVSEYAPEYQDIHLLTQTFYYKSSTNYAPSNLFKIVLLLLLSN